MTHPGHLHAIVADHIQGTARYHLDPCPPQTFKDILLTTSALVLVRTIICYLTSTPSTMTLIDATSISLLLKLETLGIK